MSTTEKRDYGGVSAATRTAARREQLLEAGLELMGTEGMAGLTVRGVLGSACLGPRYFYESFSSTDELAVAVFERIVAQIITVGLAAITDQGQGLRARIHGALDALARLMTDDPRIGRIALIESVASPVLAPRRQQALGMFTDQVSAQAGRVLTQEHTRQPADLDITARFLVGGFVETLTTALGRSTDYRDTIVNSATDLFLNAYTAISRSVTPNARRTIP